jgi:hypothetical protein
MGSGIIKKKVGPTRTKKAEKETFISVIVLTLVKQPRGDIISVHVRREILGHRLEGKHIFSIRIRCVGAMISVASRTCARAFFVILFLGGL